MEIRFWRPKRRGHGFSLQDTPGATGAGSARLPEYWREPTGVTSSFVGISAQFQSIPVHLERSKPYQNVTCVEKSTFLGDEPGSPCPGLFKELFVDVFEMSFPSFLRPLCGFHTSSTPWASMRIYSAGSSVEACEMDVGCSLWTESLSLSTVVGPLLFLELCPSIATGYSLSRTSMETGTLPSGLRHTSPRVFPSFRRLYGQQGSNFASCLPFLDAFLPGFSSS